MSTRYPDNVIATARERMVSETKKPIPIQKRAINSSSDHMPTLPQG
jgi:hypothetical protein